MQKGDWIELRDAPNTRGIVKSVHCRGIVYGCCKYHEAVHETDPVVTMLLSGGRGDHEVPLAEVDALWEPMQFTGDATPWWCYEKAVFRPVIRDSKGREMKWSEDEGLTKILKAKATVFDVKPGWVAYYDTSDAILAPVFFMATWWYFRRLWEPVKPPNAWERVLRTEED